MGDADGWLVDFSALQTSIAVLHTSIIALHTSITGLSDRLQAVADRLHAVETGLSQQQTRANDEATGAAQPLPPPQLQSPAASVTAQQMAVPQQWTVNDTLHSTRIPAVPSALPESMARLLTEHLALDLASFQVSNRTGWTDKLQNSFSKRQYLYSKIVDKAKHQTGRRGPTNENALAIAAGLLDTERGVKTVNQYLKHLKDSDANTKTRQKRKRTD